jgi:hypothetical protein
MKNLKKLREWAIHRLGGYVGTDQIAHFGRVKYVATTVKPVVLGAKVCLDRRAYGKPWGNDDTAAMLARKRLREELAEKIMEFTTVRYMTEPRSDQLVFFGELCVVRPEDAKSFIYHEEDLG